MKFILWEIVPVFWKRKIDRNRCTLRFDLTFPLNFHVFFGTMTSKESAEMGRIYGSRWDITVMLHGCFHTCSVAGFERGWSLGPVLCNPIPPTLRKFNFLPFLLQQWQGSHPAMKYLWCITCCVINSKEIPCACSDKGQSNRLWEGEITAVTSLASSPPGCACLQGDHRRKMSDWIMFAQKPAVNSLGSAVRMQFVKCIFCDCSSNKSSADVFFI